MNPKGLREDALAGERDFGIENPDLSNINRLLALDLTKHKLIHADVGDSVIITKTARDQYEIEKMTPFDKIMADGAEI